MLICLSITQILRHIYSIVDGNLYAVYEEMLTLVELHRIQKKCSVKNNKMKRLGNMNSGGNMNLVSGGRIFYCHNNNLDNT